MTLPIAIPAAVVAVSLFLMSFPISADEVDTEDGKHYEGLITHQSPSDLTIHTKNKTITFDRSDLRRVKKWSKKDNDALAEKWKMPASSGGSASAREKELKYADSVRYSDTPWEIYEEDAFIAFHHNEGITKDRLSGNVGDYCKRVAAKLGYDDFKLYDKTASPDWALKFKFYSYRDFGSWKKAVETIGANPATVLAFASGDRRVSFYELYMKLDVIYHEVAHEIYRELIKNADIPQWWNEGIAQYVLLTTLDAKKDISNSRFRALNSQYIPLTKVYLYTDEGSYSHNYEDGLSAVYFLVRERGKDKFKEFNYSLRKGKNFNIALSEVYGFKDINELEKALIEYLKKTDVAEMTGEEK